MSATTGKDGMISIVVFNDKTILDSSVETEIIVNSRQFSEDVLKWIVNGWIPLSEQELLRVMLFENDKDKKPRNFETVLSEILDKYISLSRKQRRTIMKLIKSANLGKISCD